MLSMALSIPLTTDVMLPVTCRMVTAVSTRLATASTRLDNLSRFNDSFFLRIALAAYIRAPSLLPCWSACRLRCQSESVAPGMAYLLQSSLLDILILLRLLGLSAQGLRGELWIIRHDLSETSDKYLL